MPFSFQGMPFLRWSTHAFLALNACECLLGKGCARWPCGEAWRDWLKVFTMAVRKLVLLPRAGAESRCCEATIEFHKHMSSSFYDLSTFSAPLVCVVKTTGCSEAPAGTSASTSDWSSAPLKTCVHLLPRLLWLMTSEETLQCLSQVFLGCMSKITPIPVFNKPVQKNDENRGSYFRKDLADHWAP